MNGLRITGLVLLLGGLLVANGWLGRSVIGAHDHARGLGELARFDADSTPTLDLVHWSDLQRYPGLETVTGEVFVVEPVALKEGLSRALQLLIETNDGVMAAYLGPQWTVDSGSFRLQPGDVVRLRGVQVVIAGREIFMVAEIQNGTRRLQIIDPSDLHTWRKLNESRLELALFAARD